MIFKKLTSWFQSPKPSPKTPIATPTGQTPTKNYWQSYADSQELTIVFVHGFLSNSRTCWLHENQTSYWPTFVAQDGQIGKPNVFVAGYHTEINSTSYGIRDCAQEVWSALTRVTPNMRPPIAHGQIVFVCHSLGGIVTRYLIDENRESLKGKKIGLVLVASPSKGSSYANNLQPLAKLYGNRVAEELKTQSGLIEELDKRFRKLLGSEEIDITGMEIVEHHGPIHFKWLPLRLRPVVTEDSGSKYFSDFQKIPDSDHFTICKPDRLDHESHALLVQFLLKYFPVQLAKTTERKNDIGPQSPRKNPIAARPGDPLFDTYSSNVEQYYQERNIDVSCAAAIAYYPCIWVHGPSGLGKTNLIMRLASQKSFRPISVNLANRDPGTENLVTLIRGVMEDVFRHHGYTPPGGNNDVVAVARMMQVYAEKSELCLVIDEVPISEADQRAMGAFVSTITDVLSTSKAATAERNIRIAISSISDPQIAKASFPNKASEYFRFFPIAPWDDLDLAFLLDKIASNLPHPTFVTQNKRQIVTSSARSPRNLKIMLRDYSTYAHITGPSLNEQEARLRFKPMA
ncbi:MAG TPA: hypothetical protein VGM62_11350 [Chthoniobacterales bacterium]